MKSIYNNEKLIHTSTNTVKLLDIHYIVYTLNKTPIRYNKRFTYNEAS